ncbi:MAG: tetratricopeptide repeat protein [Oligoflexia bacterium]|nr:tetratricopeptide repeat protein [Oligoflexia bacterium]
MGKKFLLIVSFSIEAALSAVLFSGCSSMFVVKSDPMVADVYYLDPKTGAKKELGKTPLEMKASVVKEAVGEVPSGGYFTVIVEQKGYIPERLMVPATRFGTLVTQLDVKLKPGTQEKEARVAKEILDHLFLAQKYALAKETDRAQAELDRILNDFPEFARALSMRASIYFAQKNYAESLKWYERALKSDPQMEDAIRMTAKIHGLESGQGTRVPTSTAQGAKP